MVSLVDDRAGETRAGGVCRQELRGISFPLRIPRGDIPQKQFDRLWVCRLARSPVYFVGVSHDARPRETRSGSGVTTGGHRP
jgi:hypothetical protein